MNNITLARLSDQIENMKCEPCKESMLVLANVLADLLTEVERIEKIACRASDTASALANGSLTRLNP